MIDSAQEEKKDEGEGEGARGGTDWFAVTSVYSRNRLKRVQLLETRNVLNMFFFFLIFLAYIFDFIN